MRHYLTLFAAAAMLAVAPFAAQAQVLGGSSELMKPADEVVANPATPDKKSETPKFVDKPDAIGPDKTDVKTPAAPDTKKAETPAPNAPKTDTIADINAAVVRLGDLVKQQSDQLTNFGKQFGDTQKQHGDDIAALKTQVAALKAQVAGSGATAEMQALRRDVSGTTAEMQKLRQDVNALADRVATFDASVSAADIAYVKRTVASLQTQVAAIQAKGSETPAPVATMPTADDTTRPKVSIADVDKYFVSY